MITVAGIVCFVHLHKANNHCSTPLKRHMFHSGLMAADDCFGKNKITTQCTVIKTRTAVHVTSAYWRMLRKQSLIIYQAEITLTICPQVATVPLLDSHSPISRSNAMLNASNNPHPSTLYCCHACVCPGLGKTGTVCTESRPPPILPCPFCQPCPVAVLMN